MPVDSYKFLPKSFRAAFQPAGPSGEEPVWAALAKPLSEAKVAVLSSAGVFLKDSQSSFDLDRERREPTWGDPGWRAIPRDVSQDQVDVAHLHINPEHAREDVGVAFGFAAFMALENEGVIGKLADENYSVMGYQERGCAAWRNETGPEIVNRLRHEAVDAIILAPA